MQNQQTFCDKAPLPHIKACGAGSPSFLDTARKPSYRNPKMIRQALGVVVIATICAASDCYFPFLEFTGVRSTCGSSSDCGPNANPLCFSASLFLPTCLALNMNMKGLLHCNATHPDPVKQTVTIELWEQDGGWFGFDKDDFLGRTVVHTSEPFEIWGSHRELDNMDIYFLIYHRCGRKEKEESAMLRVDLGRIPSLGNWNGGTATTDLGTIDLSWKWAEIEFWENSDFKKMLDEFAEVVAAHY